MSNWITLTYNNYHGKEMNHNCSIRGLADIKEIMNRYGFGSENIVSLVVDGKETNIEKVRDSLK